MEKQQKTEQKATLKNDLEIDPPQSMNSLENQLLIAMPSLGDPYFNKTVTYICEHNEEGAMGLIINLPVNITLADLLKQIEPDEGDKSENLSKSSKITKSDDLNDITLVTDVTNSLEQLVLSGGPIAQQRGFVLHSSQSGWNLSLIHI